MINREFGDFVMSPVIESQPHGFESPHAFLNVGMTVQSELEPMEILHRLQGIEKSISPASHRNADGSYRDRMIDIDIMAIDKEEGGTVSMDSPELRLPHPGIEERPFFSEPLAYLRSQQALKI